MKRKLIRYIIGISALVAGTMVAAVTMGKDAVKSNPARAAALTDIEKTLGFIPRFFMELPGPALAGSWEEMKTMRDVDMNPNSAIPPKYKDLMGLAVSAQIPCSYCVTANTEFSKLDGATEAEISEAVAMGAFTRQMSTLLNGMKVDVGLFNSDIARMVKGAQASKAAPNGNQDKIR